MKYCPVCAFLLLCFHAAAFGQTNKVDIGVEAGPNFAYIRNTNIPIINELYSTKVGFSAGLTAQYNLPKLLAIKTGISYERAGYRIVDIITMTSSTDTTSFEYNQRTHLDYLKTLLLAQMRFGSKVQYFVNAGPYLGLLAKQITIIQETPFNIIEPLKIPFDRFDAGLTFGAGLGMPAKHKWLFTLEGRYNLGLRNLAKNTPFSLSPKNRSANLLLGISYHIFKQ